MLKGVYLTLLIGPVIPVPVPQIVLDALQSVEVQITSKPHSQSSFELEFALSNDSPLQTIFLLAGGAIAPFIRVILVVTLNGIPHVLIDGVITEQHVSPGGADPGHSILHIHGIDLSALMDLQELDGVPYPAMPIAARVALILAKYVIFGIVPLPIPPIFPDVVLPVDRIPLQKGTDFAYLGEMADRVGYVFYMIPGPLPGANVAYFGPQVKVGPPQSALNINMDAQTNCETLSFSFNTEAAKLPVVFVQNPETMIPIPVPIPPLNPLQPPLGIIPPIPTGVDFLGVTANLSFVEALSLGVAAAARSLDAVTGTGSLDVLRYGGILRARELVGVRGVGLAFDGLYYVAQVTHRIKRGEYKQDFQLTRNGLVSITPRVPA